MKLAGDIARRIRMMVARAVVRGMDESGGLRRLNISILADEVKDGVEHFEAYGISSRPLPDAEALVVFLGGNRDHAVALSVTDRRYRPKDLEPGEVVIFDDQEQEIRIKRDGIFITTTRPDGVNITTTKATVTATGDVSVDSATKVVVVAPEIHLGGEGGPAVARVGDATSDAATIVGGSTKVFAVD